MLLTVLENKSNFLSIKIVKDSIILLVIESKWTCSSSLKSFKTWSEIDILFSGCNLPRATSTFNDFTKEQEIDFKLAIELFPDSIYSNYGELRCRYNVTPLQAACFNEHVPINIIEIILKVDKSLIDIPVLVNGEKVNLIDDLEDNNNILRVNSIRELFSKYST